MVLLGSLARIVFIPAGGLGGGIGVFVRVDALVAAVPIFDLVAMMLQFCCDLPLLSDRYVGEFWECEKLGRFAETG